MGPDGVDRFKHEPLVSDFEHETLVSDLSHHYGTRPQDIESFLATDVRYTKDTPRERSFTWTKLPEHLRQRVQAYIEEARAYEAQYHDSDEDEDEDEDDDGQYVDD